MPGFTNFASIFRINNLKVTAREAVVINKLNTFCLFSQEIPTERNGRVFAVILRVREVP